MKRINLITLVWMTIMPIVANAQSQIDTTYDYVPKCDTCISLDTSIMYKGPDGKYHYKVELSEKTKRELEERAKVLVATFNVNVQRLWERRLPPSNPSYQNEKRKIEKATLKLFVGDADYYYTTDSAEYDVDQDDKGYYYETDGKNGKLKHRILDTRNIFYRRKYPLVKVLETREHRPSYIFISSIKNPKGIPQKVKTYLIRARSNETYDSVEFSAEGYTPTGPLQPVSGKPGVYEGTITYIQKFRGIRGDGRSYCDLTYRTVTYEVRLIKIERVAYWDIKLRDILAKDTKSLK